MMKYLIAVLLIVSGNPAPDFVTANRTSLQVIPWLSVPHASVVRCAIRYSQSTGNALVTFGVQVDSGDAIAYGTMATDNDALMQPLRAMAGNQFVRNHNATPIVTAIPSTTSTPYAVDMNIVMDNQQKRSAVRVFVGTAVGAYPVTIYREGSFCVGL